MIFNYGFSVIGKSHIAKGTCCQDSHMIKALENGWIIAAVADGVGSAKNSQVGSSIAAKTVVEFCAEYMPWDYSVIGIKSMLRTAYNYAFKQIIKESEKTGEPIESYDTTLTTVIYDGQRIIYGHSGDGAIIGLTIYGDYVQITKPQKGVDMISVLPLRSGYTVWSIDSYEEELAAVMLMTDGMLDYALCPYLLKLSNKSEVYTPIASYFADPYGVPNSEKKAEKIKDEIKEFIIADDNYDSNKFYSRLASIYKNHLKDDADEIITKLKDKNYPCAFMQSVQDDKTMVALINTDVQFDTKGLEYYTEPDWDELQEEWNRRAYPHLYAENQTKETNDTTNGEANSNTDSEEKKDNSQGELASDATITSKEESPDVNNKAHSADSSEMKTQPNSSSIHKEGQQYQDKTGELIETKNQQSKLQKDKNKEKAQLVYYVPPIDSTTQSPKTDSKNIPPRHEKPKKENLLSRAVDALADFFGFENE